MAHEPRRQDAILRAFRAAGIRHVLTDPTERAVFAKDACPLDQAMPALVVVAESAADVVAAVRVCNRFGLPFTPRGAGTGISGGAVPVAGGVVISLTKLNRVLEVDLENRCAWVEPGLVNLHLSEHVRPYGFHYAPDPSSYMVSTIGGNVAENAGGPHCLAYGVTVNHVLGLELVLPTGEVVTLGGKAAEYPGFDLRGLVVGSEGTLGIVTKVLVKLTPNPPELRTLLISFRSLADAAAAVSAVIAAGVVPVALEMMDRPCLKVIEDYVHAGYPADAEAVLIVEVDGLPGKVAAEAEQVAAIARAHNAAEIRLATDPEQRARLWFGRRAAFGVIAKLKPNYYLHDFVVPRTRLVEVLTRIRAICEGYGFVPLNVFHAGDGNLHPLIVYDYAEPGAYDRALKAGEEITRVCIAAGGTLSGEHGIGIEKRDLMPLVFSPEDLRAMRRLKGAFDPHNLANPDKLLPLEVTA
ncbi:MAG: FAD-binding oxidoreductase [Chloroflexota bacterium]